VAKFLDKELTEDQLTKLTDHLRFDKLQQNEAVNNEGGKKMGVMNEDGRFMRKGKFLKSTHRPLYFMRFCLI